MTLLSSSFFIFFLFFITIIKPTKRSFSFSNSKTFTLPFLHKSFNLYQNPQKIMTLPLKPNSPLLPHHQESDQSTDDHKLDTFAAVALEETAQERLKRHRVAVAGQVWIPEKWGKEEFLKDWIDGSAFEASLVPSGIVFARQALAREAKRSSPNNNAATTATAAGAGALRILNGC